MYQIAKLHHHYLLLIQHLHNIKRSVFAFLLCLPTSLLTLCLVLLLGYNVFSVFCLHVPFPAKSSPEPPNFSAEYAAGEVVTRWSSSSSSKLSSSVMYAVKEENPPVILKTHLPPLQKSNLSMVPMNSSLVSRPKRSRKRRSIFRILGSRARPRQFSGKINSFLQNPSCKVRFFMTWISSIESFGDRQLFAVESVFKSHPNACLVIVSSSLDSKSGNQILRPFVATGFKLIAIRPDFDYIFKNTSAEKWFNRLKKGHVKPGEVSLGQNLSNLLRLGLLYKFGGIYIDTDVIVLKKLSKLRNVIGAQTIDLKTKNWSRLNNAVLIFDKNHPLLLKFIQEFALTFDGNKWGHNGPYLVSRVVSRVNGRHGFDFTVLNPMAFYPVNWSRIQSFFRGPKNELHSKWLHSKLEQVREKSFAVHLWNRQSKGLKVEQGSIIDQIKLDSCIFCNSSRSSL